MPINICMAGYGMMGVWHSEALAATDAVLHTVVGRRAEAAAALAGRYGYRHSTTSLAEALANPEIDAVILATPSEQHEAQAIACLEAGKHVLIEIPIAMTLAGARRVVAAGERSGLVYGVCHPMRFRPERAALLARTRGGEDRIRHFAGRFFIHRLTNVGATGYQRSWTDNLLWHHICHFVDLGLYLLDGAKVRRVQGHLGALHPLTGTPMECIVQVETEADQTLLVHGSYCAAYRIYDDLVVTDRDTLFTDNLTSTLRSASGVAALEGEQQNCARVVTDFLDAITHGRAPLAAGPSVLPAMAVLQAVQDDWDAQHGARAIPGRMLL